MAHDAPMTRARSMTTKNREAVLEDSRIAKEQKTLKNKPRPQPMTLKFLQLAFRIGGRLSANIASYYAYEFWLTPPRYKTPVSERSAFESADIQFLSVDKHNIATFSWGTTGPRVLLVHGWSGRATQLGAFVEPLLKAGYQVHSFDAPAHGKSSGKQTNLFEMVDVLLALQQHFGDFDAIITHSFGGPCACLAVQQGLKANHIVSICPPVTTRGLVNRFASMLCLTKKTKVRLLERIEKTFGKDLWQKSSMVSVVKHINIPGFIIHDVHDADVPWEEGQAVAFAWNNAPFKITNGLGHRRILKDDEVIDSTIAFITKKAA